MVLAVFGEISVINVLPRFSSSLLAQAMADPVEMVGTKSGPRRKSAGEAVTTIPGPNDERHFVSGQARKEDQLKLVDVVVV